MKRIVLLLIVCLNFVFAKEDLSGRELLEFNKKNLIKLLKFAKKDKIDINKLYSVLSKECNYIYNGEFTPYNNPIDPYEEKGICYVSSLVEKITDRIDRNTVLGYIGPNEAYIEFPNLKTFSRYKNTYAFYHPYFYIVKTNGTYEDGWDGPIPKIKFLVLAIGDKKKKNNKTYYEYKLYY